jgi:hypothetical protein
VQYAPDFKDSKKHNNVKSHCWFVSIDYIVGVIVFWIYWLDNLLKLISSISLFLMWLLENLKFSVCVLLHFCWIAFPKLINETFMYSVKESLEREHCWREHHSNSYPLVIIKYMKYEKLQCGKKELNFKLYLILINLTLI